MPFDREPDGALTREALLRIRGEDLRPVPVPDRDSFTEPEHAGTMNRYNKGCRCDNCRQANADYYQIRKSRKAAVRRHR